MRDTVINEELKVEYPNRFLVMKPHEVKEVFGVDYSEIWGIRDEKAHAMVLIVWKNANENLQKLITVKSHAKSCEKSMRKALRKNSYYCDEFFEREVAGQPAQGFHYSYINDGKSQDGAVVVFKRGRSRYTLYYYTRTDMAESNQPMLEKLLDSLALS